MRDASFRAPPSRNFAQRILDRKLKPLKHISNLWKDREHLQKMELDPDYIRNKGFASKGKAPRNNFGYNMIVNPGHKPEDSYVQFGYGGGVRDRAMGSLAAATMAAGSLGAGTSKALPVAKGLMNARKWGIPAWSAAGAAIAADNKIDSISDITKTNKSDIYKSIGKDIASTVGTVSLNMLSDMMTPIYFRKPSKGSGSVISSLFRNSNPTEQNIKKYIIGSAMKTKHKSGPLEFVKQLVQNTNPGYIGTTKLLSKLSDRLTSSSSKSLRATPIQEIIKDITSGQIANSKKVRDTLVNVINSNKGNNLTKEVNSVISDIDFKKLISDLAGK